MTAQGVSVRVVTTGDQLAQAEWTPMLDSLTEVEVVQDPKRWGRGPLAAYLLRSVRILSNSRTRGSVSRVLIVGSPFLPDLAMLAANRKATTVFIAWQLDIPHPLSEGLRHQTQGMRVTERVATQLRTAFSSASQALMLRMAERRRCSMLVINDHLEAACLERGMDRSRVIRWSYGVDRQPEPSNEFHQRPVDFCFIGRLHSQKGVTDLLGAWKLLSARIPESRLTIIGGGSGRFADWCRQEFETLGASVEYRGPLEGEAKWSVLREARVVLFPSTYESFGFVALEAMAAGAVVVGYDTDVNRSTFGDGMVRVPRGDVALLAETAAGYSIDPTLWGIQHQLCLATAARFDWEASTGRVAKRVIEECRAPRGAP
jgi:glycosyltransferase involved in cell wall biosynthesis